MGINIKDWLVTPNFTIKQCLEKINQTGESCLLVIDNKKKIIGTLSDGDIRRAFLKNANIKDNIHKWSNPLFMIFDITNHDIKCEVNV